MNRRSFIQQSGKALLSVGLVDSSIVISPKIKVKRLSSPPKHHFFGYYGINPWDKTGRFHLALETDFDDRRPEVQDTAKVGFVDRKNHRFTSITETTAFNLQQGSMMHWIDCGLGEEFTYNGYDADGKLVSYAVNFSTKIQRRINGAIAAVSPNEKDAIGLNFQRMSFCRPTVGYATSMSNYIMENVPGNDGLYSLNLKKGTSSLLLPIQEVMVHVKEEYPANRPVWLNHVLFNPSGTRMLFFCRVRKQKGGFMTSLWTINTNGSDLQCQIPFGNWVSHFDWKDDETILITSDVLGKRSYLEFTDKKQDFREIGKGILTQDGHCSYLPDPNWIISDTYPKNNDRLAEAFLYHIPTNKKISLGKFRHDPKYKGVVRCDLHPRVSKDGKIVSFDSVHEGIRHIFTIDISRVLK